MRGGEGGVTRAGWSDDRRKGMKAMHATCPIFLNVIHLVFKNCNQPLYSSSPPLASIHWYVRNCQNSKRRICFQATIRRICGTVS